MKNLVSIFFAAFAALTCIASPIPETFVFLDNYDSLINYSGQTGHYFVRDAGNKKTGQHGDPTVAEGWALYVWDNGYTAANAGWIKIADQQSLDWSIGSTLLSKYVTKVTFNQAMDDIAETYVSNKVFTATVDDINSKLGSVSNCVTIVTNMAQSVTNLQNRVDAITNAIPFIEKDLPAITNSIPVLTNCVTIVTNMTTVVTNLQVEVITIHRVVTNLVELMDTKLTSDVEALTNDANFVSAVHIVTPVVDTQKLEAKVNQHDVGLEIMTNTVLKADMDLTELKAAVSNIVEGAKIMLASQQNNALSSAPNPTFIKKEDFK